MEGKAKAGLTLHFQALEHLSIDRLPPPPALWQSSPTAIADCIRKNIQAHIKVCTATHRFLATSRCTGSCSSASPLLHFSASHNHASHRLEAHLSRRVPQTAEPQRHGGSTAQATNGRGSLTYNPGAASSKSGDIYPYLGRSGVDVRNREQSGVPYARSVHHRADLVAGSAHLL